MVAGNCSGTLEGGRRGDNMEFFWKGFGGYIVILLTLLLHRSY